MKELKLNVNGMVCGGCENRVKNAIQNIEGIESVTADHESGSVIVTSKKEMDEKKIVDTIENLGFEVVEDK